MFARERRIGIVAVVVSGLALAAPGAGSLASPTAAGAVPGSLVGCWHRRAPTLPAGVPAGTWLVSIDAKGHLKAYAPGIRSCGAYFDFSTTVTVKGDRLTIGQLPLCASTGAYTWKAAARALTLKLVSDKQCESRALLFAGTWRK